MHKDLPLLVEFLERTGVSWEMVQSDFEKYDRQNSYHNSEHMISVAIRCLNNSELDQLLETMPVDNAYQLASALFVAALYHDMDYVVGSSEGDNLDRAVVAFVNSDVSKSMPEWKSEMVKHLIYATDNRTIGQFVNDKYAVFRKIIQDADITQTLDEDGELWMQRLGKEIQMPITIKSTMVWLESVRLLTPSGNEMKDKFFAKALSTHN